MSNTTRIAKNTLMLYFRHILILLVGLYTVRIKLQILGVEDYGIYNVVGGIVLILSFINSSMTSATQRFLNVAMGENNFDKVRDIFSLSVIIHLLLGILIIILAETIGLWFFYNYLNIPQARMEAAFWVYQFSILAAFFTIINVPYKAMIISYEKMSFFALTSILEVLLKLAIIFLLTLVIFDKLIFYSVLITSVSFIIFLIQRIYCKKYFITSHFRLCKDKSLLKILTSFSGWNIFQNFSNVCNNHGANIIINIFHGVTLNTAMGIGNQVNAAVHAFAQNFQMAFRPHLTKSFAGKDYNYFKTFLFHTTKISFILVYIFILPLLLNTEFVLSLWLVTVPEYAVIFTQLILIHSIQKVLSNPVSTAIFAYGKIKKYSLITSILTFLNLPFSLLFIWLGFYPTIILIIRLILGYTTYFWRLSFIKANMNFSYKEIFINILFPIIIISFISIIITFFIKDIFTGWYKLFFTGFISIIIIGLLSYFIGFNKNERIILIKKLKSFFKIKY